MRAVGVRPALLFLVGIGFFVRGAAAGSHNILQYNLTVVSQDGSVESRFYGEVLLNNRSFLHYDSENGRAKPWGPWAEAILGAETRNAESELFTQTGKDLRITVARIDNLHKRGLHSFQEIWGCEIREDGSTRGFRDFRYDGEPVLSYDLKTQRWTVLRRSAQALAESLQRSLDEGAAEARKHYGYVQRDCVEDLGQYLRSCMGFQKPVSPTVNVTRSEALGGTINVTCWAFGFYPPNISLAWHQDGQPLSQDAQGSGGVLPNENGTYQAWVVTRIPQGEEPRFTCHMGHCGNHSTHPVPGKTVELQSSRASTKLAVSIAAAVILVIFGVVGVILCVYWNKKKTTSSAGCPEPMELQVLDTQMAVTGDQNGSTQREFQTLLSAPGSADRREGS